MLRRNLCVAAEKVTKLFSGQYTLRSEILVFNLPCMCMHPSRSFYSSTSVLAFTTPTRLQPCATLQRRVAPCLNGILQYRWRRGVHVAAAASQQGPDLSGYLVEFKKDDNYILGTVRKKDGKKNWIVVDLREQEHSVRPQQLVFQTKCDERLTPRVLAEFAASNSDADVLAAAWEAVAGRKDAIPLDAMAELLFGDNTPLSCYATHRLLAQDRLYFKYATRSPPTYLPRTSADVASLKKQQEALARTQRELEELKAEVARIAALPAALKPPASSWVGGPHASRLKALLLYACEADPNPANTNLATSTLMALSLQPSPDAAVVVLKQLGVIDLHEPFQLHRVGGAGDFAPHLKEAAEKLAAKPKVDDLAPLRQDFRHQQVFMIDDASTVEVDDGISITTLPDGRWEVWVHVAHPTRWLDARHPLMDEAKQRAKTLYLPTGHIPMFPDVLSSGLFSLRENEECDVISVGGVLAADGLVEEWSVTPARIARSVRWTYEEADDVLLKGSPQEHPDFFALAQACRLRRKWRDSQNCLEFSLPEAEVKVKGTGEAAHVAVTAVHQKESPSRQMVAELMIMAGEIIGLLGAQERMPLPYRSQAPLMIPADVNVEEFPEGYLRDMELRRYMRGARSSATDAAPHAALGIEAYVQFTSPIRRVGDLLAHFQVHAWLLEKPLPFGAAELQQTLEQVADRNRALTGAENAIQTYWLAHYFHQELQRKQGRRWEGTVLAWRQQAKGIARVLIEELGLEVSVDMAAPVVLGDRVELSVSGIDLLLGTYELRHTGVVQMPREEVYAAA